MPRRASIETHGRPPLYPCSLRFWSCPPSFKFQRVSATGASLPRHLEFQSDFKYSMVKTGSHFHTYIWSLETLTVNQWKIHSKLRRYQNYPQFLFNPSKLVTVAHTELGVSISDSYGEKKWKHNLTHPKSFNFSSEEGSLLRLRLTVRSYLYKGVTETHTTHKTILKNDPDPLRKVSEHSSIVRRTFASMLLQLISHLWSQHGLLFLFIIKKIPNNKTTKTFTMLIQ